jgi:hypothetical protein
MKTKTRQVTLFIADDGTEHETLTAAVRADVTSFCTKQRTAPVLGIDVTGPLVAWLVEHRVRLANLLNPDAQADDS